MKSVKAIHQSFPEAEVVILLDGQVPVEKFVDLSTKLIALGLRIKGIIVNQESPIALRWTSIGDLDPVWANFPWEYEPGWEPLERD